MIQYTLKNNVKAYPVFGMGLAVFILWVTSGAALAAGAATQNMTIDQRLSNIERRMANQNMLEAFNQLQNLQREIETLRGDLEVLSHDISLMKQRQKDLYQDLDTRIQAVETAAKSTALPGSAFSTDRDAAGSLLQDGGVPSGESLVAPVREQEAYQLALTLLKDGKYAEAVQQFQILLISYPQGDYADNAQYWMGEAHYVMKDFKSAIVEFAKVIKKYPNSSKLADSHLKIGFSYYELEDWKNAKLSLETVLKQFPSTTAARLAERRLQQMKIEGRG